MGNLTPIARGLLIINIFVYIADLLISKGGLQIHGVLWYVESPNFKPWQLLTHMFLHGDFFHLLSNMMGLFFFGPWLERAWGARNFFIFYIACGFGGAALQMGGVGFQHNQEKAVITEYSKTPTVASLEAYQKKHQPKLYEHNEGFFKEAKRVIAQADKAEKDTILTALEKQKILADKAHFTKEAKKAFSSLEEGLQGNFFRMLGASGAIFGILIAFALFFPNVEMMLLFFPFPIKAKYFVLFYMLFTIYAAAGGNVGLANVAHLAHLGGAVTGLILARLWLWKYRY